MTWHKLCPRMNFTYFWLIRTYLANKRKLSISRVFLMHDGALSLMVGGTARNCVFMSWGGRRWRVWGRASLYGEEHQKIAAHITCVLSNKMLSSLNRRSLRDQEHPWDKEGLSRIGKVERVIARSAFGRLPAPIGYSPPVLCHRAGITSYSGSLAILAVLGILHACTFPDVLTRYRPAMAKNRFCWCFTQWHSCKHPGPLSSTPPINPYYCTVIRSDNRTTT